jgi:methionine-rich copper-binding protein CopC
VCRSGGSRTRPRSSALLTTVALAVLGIVVGLARPASAHDHLSSMAPAAGSRLSSVPPQVSLTFDEPVGALGSTLTVTDPSGARIDARVPEVAGRTIGVSLAVPAAPLKGTYEVDYRVVSADGHVVSDRESFEVTTGAAPATTASAGTAGQVASSGFLGGHGGRVLLVGAVAALALAYVAFDLVRRRRAR